MCLHVMNKNIQKGYILRDDSSIRRGRIVLASLNT